MAPKRPAAGAAFLDHGPRVDSFRDAVLRGLSARPKRIPAKYFYDAEGSRLFEAITDQPEYYPTRAELALLETHGAEIGRLLGEGVQVVEFGSGSSRKVRLLLAQLACPAGYVAIDISSELLKAECDSLAADFPGLEVLALCADYMQDTAVPPPSGGMRRRVAYFPGSTIGNLEPGEAIAFLARWRPDLQGGGMLVGVDLKKDGARLNAAYNDEAGVTAAFNLNLLRRANRELDGAFDPDGFAHRAFYDPAADRVEMHLVSLRDQIVAVAGRRFRFTDGETIHTENSYKYSALAFADLAARAGYRPARLWTDPDGQFSLHWLEA